MWTGNIRRLISSAQQSGRLLRRTLGVERFTTTFRVQPGDIVASEHWASSGFPNTDLEHKLKRYGKEKIICVGLLANTCLEATARIGMELGFTSRWFETGQQLDHMKPCMPRSTLTVRPLLTRF